MKTKSFLKNALIHKHGNPDDEKALDDYLTLMLNPPIFETGDYSEKHHILTRSQFPEFINDDWNLTELLYEDHIKAHELLFQAFNLRTYQYPLYFMKNGWDDKDTEMVSNASKKGWIKLKSNEEKYNQWKQNRSDYMKSLSTEEQSRRAQKTWDNYSEEDYKKRCKIAKDQWTDERKREYSERFKKLYKDNPDEASRRAIKAWSNKSEERRIEFNETMSEVNKDPVKRAKASVKIKEKWQDPEWRNKMLKRKTKPGSMYIIITPENETFERSGLAKISREFNISEHYIRTFKNKGPITHEDPKISHMLGWEFKQIK